MKTLINKAATAVSSVVLFTVGCVMVGLGFAVVGMLAMFALVAVGAALLASPFVQMAQPQDDATDQAPAAA